MPNGRCDASLDAARSIPSWSTAAPHRLAGAIIAPSLAKGPNVSAQLTRTGDGLPLGTPAAPAKPCKVDAPTSKFTSTDPG
jgi:hypothetical protein